MVIDALVSIEVVEAALGDFVGTGVMRKVVRVFTSVIVDYGG